MGNNRLIITTRPIPRQIRPRASCRSNIKHPKINTVGVFFQVALLDFLRDWKPEPAAPTEKKKTQEVKSSHRTPTFEGNFRQAEKERIFSEVPVAADDDDREKRRTKNDDDDDDDEN